MVDMGLVVEEGTPRRVPAPAPEERGRRTLGVWQAPGRFEPIALALLAVGLVVAFFAYRAYPTYDAAYSLIWGRELLHGTLPSFDAYRAATDPPLAVAFSVLLAPLGESADRAWIALTMFSFGAFLVGVYRLQRALAGCFIGVIAALVLLPRPDFVLLGITGRVEAPYFAFVIWAF